LREIQKNPLDFHLGNQGDEGEENFVLFAVLAQVSAYTVDRCEAAVPANKTAMEYTFAQFR